jgi:hypothetical protein
MIGSQAPRAMPLATTKAPEGLETVRFCERRHATRDSPHEGGYSGNSGYRWQGRAQLTGCS